MHDPAVVVFSIRRPWPYLVRYSNGRRRLSWPDWVDVWHDEPEGADSGTVCKGMRGTQLTWHNLRWALRHRSHLRVVVVPLRRIRQWLRDRCGECGRRFLWRDSRHGYWSGDAVYHAKCMEVRALKGQLDDALRYITHTADRDARWRVEYKLEREPDWTRR